MADGRETDAVGGDSIVTELVQALGARIKSIEVDRVISETERRVTVRVQMLSLEDVKMAYIDEAAPIPPHVLRDPAAWRR